MRALRRLRMVLALGLVLAPAPAVRAQAPDAGPARPDARPRPHDARPPEAAPRDAGAAADGWLAARTTALEACISRLRAELAAVGQLKPTDLTPAGLPVRLAKLDLTDEEAVTGQLKLLAGQRADLIRRQRDTQGRLDLVEPSLKLPAQRLAALTKRRRRWRRIKIPAELTQQVARASQQLKLLRLERDEAQAQVALLDAVVGYLKAGQPARLEARKRQDEALRRATEEKRAAEKARQQAMAEQQSADRAQQAALEAQRRAVTEAERLLATEGVRLQGVRGKQARQKDRLARAKAQLARRRTKLEQLRNKIAAAADVPAPENPAAAAALDPLYDTVVAELKRLRPQAMEALGASMRGLPDPPHPGAALSSPVLKLDKIYGARVARLEKLRARLAAAAAALGATQDAQLAARLQLLTSEIDWLNARRLALLPRVSKAKRSELTGLSQQAIEQLGREVTQLLLDGLSWAHRRLGQVDQIPGLIRDVFTVGSLMWTLIKLVLLLLLLRFVLKRWDAWLVTVVQYLSRSMSFGRYTLRATKLLDILRHAGPTLLVLLVGVAVFRLLGGHGSGAELRSLYVVFFWIAVYRLQLRVVESVAKHVGLEQALRAVEGAATVAPEELEGPPAPGDPPARSLKPTGEHRPVQPPPVLLVRSVRAATRYMLVVILVLELTALAVGKGSIYSLTARFSWWAAVPFVLYFLQLWRPHIQRAYRDQLGDREEGTLGRLVRSSERRFYGVFVIGAAFAVVLAARVADFGRQYLSSLDATKKLLAFIFRRQVEKHAHQQGRVLAQRQDLPAELLRCFPSRSLTPTQGGRRIPLMDQVKELFETWQQDQSDGSAAVVAPAGMGKTTALRALEQELGTPVLHGEARTKITRPAKVVSWLSEVFNISPKPSSERDLVRRICEEPHQVVAVDSCHNLFLRQVGGFDGWECLLRVVNQTCDNVFWFLAFNRAAHDYLQQVSGHVQYLRRTFHLPQWTEDELRRDIMHKMRRARVGVSFSDLVVTQLQGLSASAQAGRTSSGYFRMLWDYTSGNPRLASQFWLDSLVLDPEGRAVRVHLFSTPEVDELEQLPADMHFVLTTISQHENLTAAEVASTSGLPVDFCNFAVRLGLEEGYLFRDPKTDRLRLSWRWQQTAHRFLRRQRLLYG